MKSYASAVTAHRAANKRFEAVHLISFRVRDSEGANVWFSFSNRPYNETISVPNPLSGEDQSRDYIGGGALVSWDPIVRTAGTKYTTLNIVLSGTSDDVKDMVLGHNMRNAVVQWHVGELDQDTRLLLATPALEFDGFVIDAFGDDGSVSVGDPAPASSAITLVIASHIHALTRVNPDVRSLEAGKERSDDEIFKYADESNTWDDPWGKEGRAAKKRGRNHDRGKDKRDRPDGYTYNPFPDRGR